MAAPERATAVLDLATARVVRALAGSGVQSLLLRGPAVRLHLYGPDPRTYRDIDLLVPPAAWSTAVDVLAQLGFDRREASGATTKHGMPCRDENGMSVDLHRRILGAQAGDADGWDLLYGRSQTTTIASTSVRVPDRVTTLVIVALHAAQHGCGREKPLGDLARALAAADPGEWREALGLAEQLGARDAVAAGLRLHAAGARLCDELGLGPPTRAAVRLRMDSSAHAVVLADLFDLPARARPGALVRVLFPTRKELLERPWTRKLAARRATLPLALLLRWLHGARSIRGAVRPYVRARRYERGTVRR